jgi:predicted negative regulator of RcsB-dependent stress response
MSTYDLEEQEQLAALKSWWKQYGGLLLLILAAACAVLAAWSGWGWYQRSQAAQAATGYDQLQKSARTNDIKGVRESAGAILEKHARSVYAPLAALISAKVHAQAGDATTARAQLQWVVDHARSPELRSIAILRLASVMMDAGALEEAEKLINQKPAEGFEGLFSVMRGDVMHAQSKFGEARAAYRQALDGSSKLDPAMQNLVQMKLDALGDA